MKIGVMVLLICNHVDIVNGFGFSNAPNILNIKYTRPGLSLAPSARAKRYECAVFGLQGSFGHVQYGELQHCGVLVDDVDTAL
jgi:hypothetical protein